MLTDQDLIDGLRRELDDLHAPTDLLQRLRIEPHRATKSRVRRRWSRLPVGALAAAASTALVLSIAVGGLLLVHHRTPKPATATGTHPADADQTVQRLAASQFGVFRRPQTAKDRTLPAAVRSAVRLGGLGPDIQAQLGGVIPELTRYTQTLPGGREVFLTVYRPSYPRFARGGQSPPAGNVLIIGVFIVQPDGTWTEGQPVISPTVGETSGDAWLEARTGREGCGLDTYWVIAPDQVAQIRWQFGRQDPAGFVFNAPLTVNMTVHGNVAVTTIPQRTSCDRPATITLYGRDGQTLSHTGNATNLNRVTRPASHGNPFSYQSMLHRPTPGSKQP